MPTLPAELLNKLPPHAAQVLLHQLQQGASSRRATEKDLIDAVKKQWNPRLSILNYYRVDALPRQPFTRELTHSPPRSKYYETFLCTCVFFFAILLIRCLEYLLVRGRLRALVKNQQAATWLQFFVLTIPFLICVLDFPVKSYAMFALIFNTVCVAIYLACRAHRRMTGPVSSPASGKEMTDTIRELESGQQKAESGTNRQTTFRYNDLLAIYRSIVYISTTVCIFARDQPCWNNDFSKTHSFGTGLMDVGIGCFIVCIGSLGPTANRSSDQVDRPLALRKAALQSAILTVCGLVKTSAIVISNTVKNVQSDEAWTEYGVHWNAFYSLAVARGLGATLELLLLPTWMPPLVAALVLAGAHEALLASGLAHFVLAPGLPQAHNRSNLLTLYFAGLQLGRWTKPTEVGGSSPRNRRLGVPARVLALLVASAAVRPLAMADDGFWLLSESRRLMNPAYCAWLLAFSCFSLSGVWMTLEAGKALMDTRDGNSRAMSSETDRLTPIHLQQVDSTGLLYFLVSNLLTGLFNLIISRLSPNRESLDGAPCFLIILVYTGVAFCFSRVANRWVSIRKLQTVLMQCLWTA